MNVFQKSLYIENTETYLQKKNVPIDPFISLGVNDQFFNPEAEQDGNEAEGPSINPTETLINIFADPTHAELRAKIALIIQPGKYEYLMKACALMSSGELTFNSIIEISRFKTALKYLNSDINIEELWFLANTCGCGQVEEEDAKDGGEEKIKTRTISF